MSDILLWCIIIQQFCICGLLFEIWKKMPKAFDPLAPTNQYGEGLSEGIQNAIVRGQRGIMTND